MKFTLQVYITDLVAFTKGDYSWAFSVFPDKRDYMTEWFHVGEMEIDVPRTVANDCVRSAVRKIDQQIKDTRVRHEEEIQMLERTRQEILALPEPNVVNVEGNGTG